MGLFQEYLNSKGQVEKGTVNVTGDRVDPMKSPNAPKGGKPYACSNGKPKMAKEKGFGDQGDSKLKYEPKVDKSKGVTPAKIPTAEQAELCSVVVDAIKKDASIIEELVCQLRANNLLAVTVAEMLQYGETYKHLAEVMAHKEYGPAICKRLVRAAMTEEVSPPFSATLEDEEKEDEASDEPENEFPGAEAGINDAEGQPDMGAEMNGIAGSPPPQAANPLMQPPPMQPGGLRTLLCRTSRWR
jgi:hypothetical protein